MDNPMSSFDCAIIGIYLMAVVGLGVAAGFLRRKNEQGGEGGHYFIARHSCHWRHCAALRFPPEIESGLRADRGAVGTKGPGGYSHAFIKLLI
jgi:hypothetical protein